MKHLGNLDTMSQVARLYPWMQWHCWGVRGALGASPNAGVAGEPSGPGDESSVWLESTSLYRGEMSPAVHFCGSQVDGRDILQGGTERVMPKGSAPASVLSCWSAGRGDRPARSDSSTDRGREVKESVLNFWQTAGSRLTLFVEQTINSFM